MGIRRLAADIMKRRCGGDPRRVHAGLQDQRDPFQVAALEPQGRTRQEDLFETQETEMMDLFHILDTDGEGVLSLEEFKQGMGRLAFLL